MVEEFKLGKLDSFLTETGGWVFVMLIFAGIWLNEFRWRLIFSAIFIISLMIINVKSKEMIWEKKHDK